VSVDDVVIAHSDNQPRAFWRLGRITVERCYKRDVGVALV